MKPPNHLRPATRRWFSATAADFELQAHHLRLLQVAAEAWDRGEAAREAIAERGMTYSDRLGNPRLRPEVGVERDARIAFMRALRELGLDVAEPAERERPPVLPANRRA